jgi:hypothetical protein
MGFLDQSTNNIILDAVLTNKGREFLAANDGSFSIIKFALGDDEIDYGMITQFGRNVGKEKIEKNTPILEALTQGDLAMRHKLRSVSDPLLTSLPSLAIGSPGSPIWMALNDSPGTGTGTNMYGLTAPSQEFKQSMGGTNSTSGLIPNELIDSAFTVQCDNRFVMIGTGVADSVSANSIATYTLARQGNLTGQHGGKLQINVRLKSISDTVFSTFQVANTAYIRTYITVTGVNSGAMTQLEVKITKLGSQQV